MLGGIGGPEEIPCGDDAVWDEEGYDIICLLGREMMFGIKAGASLGCDLMVLAYISALSCIVLALPADNGRLLCLGLPLHLSLCPLVRCEASVFTDPGAHLRIIGFNADTPLKISLIYI